MADEQAITAPTVRTGSSASKLYQPLARFLNNNGLAIATMLAFVLLLEIYVRVADVPQYILPAPSVILTQMITRSDLLLEHSAWTVLEVLQGFFLGVVVAIPLAVAIVYSKFFEKTIYTFLVSSQAVPKVALAPILIAWFGFGQTPKIIIAFLISFFPIVVSTVVGLRSMPVEMLYLARSLGASGWETFWKFRLPHGLPSIFGGLKVAISLAVVGAVIGDYVAGIKGLGYLQVVMAGNLNIPMVFAILVYLSIIGIILFNIVTYIEGRVIHWDPNRRAERAQER